MWNLLFTRDSISCSYFLLFTQAGKLMEILKCQLNEYGTSEFGPLKKVTVWNWKPASSLKLF